MRVHRRCVRWLDPELEISMRSKAEFDMTATKKDVTESYKLLGRNVMDLGYPGLASMGKRIRKWRILKNQRISVYAVKF